MRWSNTLRRGESCSATKQPRAANGAALNCLQTISATGCNRCAEAGNARSINDACYSSPKEPMPGAENTTLAGYEGGLSTCTFPSSSSWTFWLNSIWNSLSPLFLMRKNVKEWHPKKIRASEGSEASRSLSPPTVISSSSVTFIG